MTDEERGVAACLLIEKAERNFEQAQKNADMGYWDLVANRLSYRWSIGVHRLSRHLFKTSLPE